MQLHDLQPNSSERQSRRVGRGGKRGKTSGRGTKGQKARAGRKLRPEMRDTIKKLPKLRGHGKNRARGVNSSRVHAVVINVGTLSAASTLGDVIKPETLRSAGLVRFRNGKMPVVKVLGTGTLERKITIVGCLVSESAKQKIEKAGGTVQAATR